MQRYTTTAIILHWLTALLIISAFVMGLVMTDIPGLTPTKLKYFSWHKWLGVTVLAIAAIRCCGARPTCRRRTRPAWLPGKRRRPMPCTCCCIS